EQGRGRQERGRQVGERQGRHEGGAQVVGRPEHEVGHLTLVGVDTGGTFTDLVAVVGGRLRTLNVPSTPRDPARAVRAGIVALLGTVSGVRLHYGSTVATNALLERRGARVVL